jgi:hypothetical protein
MPSEPSMIAHVLVGHEMIESPASRSSASTKEINDGVVGAHQFDHGGEAFRLQSLK